MSSFQLDKLDLRDDSQPGVLSVKHLNAWKQGLPVPGWFAEQIKQDIDEYHKAKTESREFQPVIRIERNDNEPMNPVPGRKPNIVGDASEELWAKEPDNSMEPEEPNETVGSGTKEDWVLKPADADAVLFEDVRDEEEEDNEQEAAIGNEPAARPKAFFPTFSYPAPRQGSMQPASGSKIDGMVPHTNLPTEPELPWGLTPSILQSLTGPLEVAAMFGSGLGNGKSQTPRLAKVRGKDGKKPYSVQQPTAQNPPKAYYGPIGDRDYGLAEGRQTNDKKDGWVERQTYPSSTKAQDGSSGWETVSQSSAGSSSTSTPPAPAPPRQGGGGGGFQQGGGGGRIQQGGGRGGNQQGGGGGNRMLAPHNGRYGNVGGWYR